MEYQILTNIFGIRIQDIVIWNEYSVYLHILRMLDRQSQECRSVGFYHRNTSQTRKDEILFDLKLPLKSLSKKLKCVIATVSLGNKKATIQ